jgi:hypothetical protein
VGGLGEANLSRSGGQGRQAVVKAAVPVVPGSWFLVPVIAVAQASGRDSVGRNNGAPGSASRLGATPVTRSRADDYLETRTTMAAWLGPPSRNSTLHRMAAAPDI